MQRKSKTLEEYELEFREDNLSKVVFKNDQFKSVALGNTLENYGYHRTNSVAATALANVAKEFGFHTIKTRISGMEVTEHTAALGWDAITKPALFAIVNEKTGRCLVSTSNNPSLRRAVMQYWLKNIHVFHTTNTFFGCTKLIEDVEKYGVDSFKLHIIQEIPVHLSPKARAELEKEAEKLAGDNLYMSKSIHPRNQSPLREFLHYHPELIECDRRFREIKAHYFDCADKRALLKGPKYAHERYILAPILKAATEEYSHIYTQHMAIRAKLEKLHSQKDTTA